MLHTHLVVFMYSWCIIYLVNGLATVRGVEEFIVSWANNLCNIDSIRATQEWKGIKIHHDTLYIILWFQISSNICILQLYIYRQSRHMDFNFPYKPGGGITGLLKHTSSSGYIDLIGQLCIYDPDDRITAKQALRHPYFKDLRQDLRVIKLGRVAKTLPRALSFGGLGTRHKLECMNIMIVCSANSCQIIKFKSSQSL